MAFARHIPHDDGTRKKNETNEWKRSLLHERNRDVAKKLGVATLLMCTLPVTSFYVALHFLFPHKDDPTTWAGGVAALFTNVIVAGYVVAAFNEGDDNADAGRGGDDAAGPRAGALKRRTD